MSKKEVLMTQEETEVMQATGVPAQEIDSVGVIMATEIIADLKKQVERCKRKRPIIWKKTGSFVHSRD